MSESEIKARLEGTLRSKITWAEWQHLKRAELVRDFANEMISWEELRDFAGKELRRVRCFYEDKRLEAAGAIEAEDDLEFSALTSTELPYGGTPETGASLSDRTVARARAMSALNRLHAGDRFTPRPIIDGTHKPRGGVDGSFPQWVIFLAVEAWVPAEEVKEAYRINQHALLAEQTLPKTKERAFEVARFVWEEERLHGMRPPWPVLWARWNDWPLTKPFNTWRDFRTYFLRGKQATLPQYSASNEQIIKQVDSGAHEQNFNAWVSSFRE